MVHKKASPSPDLRIGGISESAEDKGTGDGIVARKALGECGHQKGIGAGLSGFGRNRDGRGFCGEIDLVAGLGACGCAVRHCKGGYFHLAEVADKVYCEFKLDCARGIVHGGDDGIANLMVEGYAEQSPFIALIPAAATSVVSIGVSRIFGVASEKHRRASE